MNDDAMNNNVIQTPGEKLSGLRLESGRSLDELAAATKIPLPMLQAIEMDEYHKVSGELYVKSFLRAYASEVGVEAEEILDLYASYTGAVETADDGSSPGVWHEEEVQIKRIGFPWRNLAVIATVAVVVLGTLYFFLGREDTTGEPTGEPTLNASEGDPEITEVHETVAENQPHSTDDPENGGDSLLRGGPLANTVPQNHLQPAREQPTATAETPAEPALEKGPDSAPASRLIAALPGGPNDLVISGRGWPVVLRLIGNSKQGVWVKKDGDREYTAAQYSEDPLIAGQDEVQAGKGYLVTEGWVTYWGAEDHFSLKMDSSEGAQATINGQYRDLGGLNSGQELILNDPAVIQSNLPSVRP